MVPPVPVKPPSGPFQMPPVPTKPPSGLPVLGWLPPPVPEFPALPAAPAMPVLPPMSLPAPATASCPVSVAPPQASAKSADQDQKEKLRRMRNRLARRVPHPCRRFAGNYGRAELCHAVPSTNLSHCVSRMRADFIPESRAVALTDFASAARGHTLIRFRRCCRHCTSAAGELLGAGG